MSVASLHALLERARAQRLAPEVPVWELAAPWWPFSRRARRHEALRGELLEGVLALGAPAFLAFEENPQAYEVGGVWSHAAEGTWRVPDPCPLAQLERSVLVLGGWTLYVAHRPVDAAALPDGFRVAPTALADFTRRAGMPALVQAFHDSEPWRIALEELPERASIAA